MYCAAFPEPGLGMALKCDDGQKRASEAGLIALIQKLDLMDEQQAEYFLPVKSRITIRF